MTFLRQYLMSLITASIIVGIIASITKSKKSGTSIIRLVSGIFLSLVMLKPILKIEIQDYMDFYNDISLDASAVVDDGKNIYQTEMQTIIKENLEAYILDKASALQLDVDVDIFLSDGIPPIPETIRISGNTSPYNKQVFQTFLADKIGLSKEQQIWQ